MARGGGVTAVAMALKLREVLLPEFGQRESLNLTLSVIGMLAIPAWQTQERGSTLGFTKLIHNILMNSRWLRYPSYILLYQDRQAGTT